MKKVKIVVGANYGDEGKGLMTRYFAQEALNNQETPVIILHNGTAQRGHTVDYNPNFRHVYHHFGSGTYDGVPTYLTSTFLIHPMEFYREWNELYNLGITPLISYDPDAKVITPFDMLADRATEEWIAQQNGKKEYGSCGYGSWCAAEDRIPMGKTAYTIKDLTENFDSTYYLLEEVWKNCRVILKRRGVDFYQTSFANISEDLIIRNFIEDLKFFFNNAPILSFDKLWEKSDFNTFIFENGQGLGLDKDINNKWHTTSHTGIQNPVNLLRDKDFEAEVCYVTRSYITRHGDGPLEDEVSKEDICADMVDITNMPNEFQGSLRYSKNMSGFWDRIIKEYFKFLFNKNFIPTIAVTHLNELRNPKIEKIATYISNNPYTIIKK